ncbi:unnamed protein product [Lepidochelys kempii]
MEPFEALLGLVPLYPALTSSEDGSSVPMYGWSKTVTLRKEELLVLPDLMDILYEMPKQATDFGRNSISYQRFLFYERKLA